VAEIFPLICKHVALQKRTIQLLPNQNAVLAMNLKGMEYDKKTFKRSALLKNMVILPNKFMALQLIVIRTYINACKLPI